MASPQTPPVTSLRTPRARGRLGGAAALTVCLVLGAAPAAWSAPATSTAGGRQVVGTLVRADAQWEQQPLLGDAHAHEVQDELAWIQDGSAAGVRVDPDDVADVPGGARVRAVLGDRAAPDGTEAKGLAPAREVLSATVVPQDPARAPSVAGAPPAVAAGEQTSAALVPRRHEVSVVMAVPAGGRRGSASLADVVASVDGPTSDFWSSQTGGAVTFSVTATQDYVDLTASCASPNALWDEAARKVGFTGGADRHLLVYVGDQGDACAAGLGTVGSGPDAGGAAYVSDEAMSIVAHELGHNLGLRHSGKLRCEGAAEPAGSAGGAGTGASPGSAGCEQAEYYDLYDVMAASWGPTGSLSAPQAHHLGVLPPAQGADVPSAGGRFTLAPAGGSSGLRALRLADSGGATYWVELREPVGRDAYLSDPRVNRVGLQPGVLVRREEAPTGGVGSLLLDPTPSARGAWTSDFAAALAPGRSLDVAGGRWRVAVASVTGSGPTWSAVVDVAPAAPGATTRPDGTLTAGADAPAPGPTPAPDPTSGPTPAPAPDPGPAAPPGAPVVAETSRREGPDRYATAVAVSRASHPGTATTVVVASGETYPDALAAGPVAAAAGGPLLLVPRDGPVGEDVLAELARLAPQRVVLAGGTGAVGDAVAARLEQVAPLTRVSGGDRYDTAARLALSTGQRGRTVYLASGASAADAVSGGALAAHEGASVLLTARDALPAASADALAALAPTRVVVLGGVAGVGIDVEARVRAALPDAAVERVGGADRYATAAALARAGYPDGAAVAYLAAGDAFADALAGGPAAGAEGAPLLLTTRTCVPAATADALAALGTQRAVVLGGPSAVGADALRRC